MEIAQENTTEQTKPARKPRGKYNIKEKQVRSIFQLKIPLILLENSLHKDSKEQKVVSIIRGQIGSSLRELADAFTRAPLELYTDNYEPSLQDRVLEAISLRKQELEGEITKHRKTIVRAELSLLESLLKI